MKALMFLLQILPALIDVLRSIESIYPDAGKGADKLALIQKLLTNVYPDVEKYWPAVEKAIGVLVDWFNNVGVFKKG